MTQEDVVVLWKDANGWDVRGYKNTLEDLERFAKLVAKHTLSNIDPSKFISCQEVMEAARMAEREACAKVADNRLLLDASSKERDVYDLARKNIAADIRARGEQA